MNWGSDLCCVSAVGGGGGGVNGSCGSFGGAGERVQFLQAQLFPVCTITANNGTKLGRFWEIEILN